jgi:hypothetical protein
MVMASMPVVTGGEVWMASFISYVFRNDRWKKSMLAVI